ncbi:hypothetical protein [Nocardioides dongkuii]|uniref:hypothetical protein n=1 Tax=Nocardioides dongkuii TaxID=2760089 RepID=UPI0015FADA80|nr:hypothetical protein [Nocardioides dongkuii]
MRRRLRIVLAVAVALLVVTGAVVAVLWWRAADRTDLERALALGPAGAERVSWTAWEQVRRELGADVDDGSSAEELETFLGEGYDADLTSTSALVESAAVLHEEFGWSPASVAWELFVQSGDGAAVVVGLPESLDTDELGDRLADLGYTRPESETGVWVGGGEVLATAAAGRPVSPVLQHVALDAEEHVLTAGDDAAYVESVVADRGGDEDFEEVADAVGEPLTAALYRGSHACAELAMSQSDTDAQAEAEQLVTAAGEVGPYTAFAMGVQPDLDVLVALSFETEDQAEVNADSRAVLASGAAPGQGGTFPDRFELGEVTADGTVVRMPLAPVEGASVLSDLSTGPVLFATC